MSANLLEKVTPGPWHADEPLGRGGFKSSTPERSILAADRRIVTRIRIGKTTADRDHADAQLIALAYDHALWGAAATACACAITGKSEIVVYLGGKAPPPRFSFTLDAFGCPTLTPDLREALKKALDAEGVK